MPDYLETQEFLRDFQNGAKEAFEAFFDAYFERLYVFSYNMTGHDQEAEDIVMGALTRLFLNHDPFPGLANIRSYAYVSVKNRSLDYLKRAKRVSRKSDVEFQKLVHEDPDLVNTQIWGEQMKALYVAVEQLPEECRKVFQLLYFEGLKYKEVADRLGISVNSVKTQRRIGLIKLRSMLNDKNLMALLAIKLSILAHQY